MNNYKYRDQYIQVWFNSLSINSHEQKREETNYEHNYRLFKSNFELKAYLCNIQKHYHHTVLTRLALVPTS